MKKKLSVALLTGLMLCMTACGSPMSVSTTDNGSFGVAKNSIYEGDSVNGSFNAASEYNDYDYDYDESFEDSTEAPVVETTNRKIIRDCRITLESEKGGLSGAVDYISGLVDANGGYAEDMTVNRNNADFTLRIPTDHVDAFLGALNSDDNNLKVDSLTDTKTDVTSSYSDTEGRLDAKKQALARYRELLDQAQSVGETLEILNAISDIEGEIEGYTRQLKSYDGLIDYTSITVYIYEEEAKMTPVKDVLSELGETLARNLAGFLTFLAGAIFVIPTALFIIFLIVKVIRLALGKNHKRIKRKKQETVAKKPEKEQKVDADTQGGHTDD